MKFPGAVCDFRVVGAYRRALKETNKNFPDHLTAVPRERWPDDGVANRAGVWRSSHFLVQAYAERGDVLRLSVNRTDIDSKGRWVDGITWDELQKIKTECGFGDRDAVEVFPPDADVVNVANMRHLWVLPVFLPFAWRTEKQS